MTTRDPALRYFSDVYPVLRGVAGPSFASAWTRGLTEPGQTGRLDWVLDRIGPAPRSVLDAGCGPGRFTVELASRGHHVSAVDVSPAMVRSAERAVRVAGVGPRAVVTRGDLRTWSPNGRFDVVLCIGVAEYYPHVTAFLERLYTWSDTALLATLTKRRTGPRGLARGAWLALHGVRSRCFDAAEARRIAAGWDGARVEVWETRWTWCVEVRRVESAAAKPAVAAGGGRGWPVS